MKIYLTLAACLILTPSAFSSDFTLQHPEGGLFQDAESTRKLGGVGNYIFRYSKEKIGTATALMPREIFTEDEISYEQSSTDRSTAEQDRLFFNLNSSELKPSGVKKVEKLSETLKKDPDKKAYIYGYADNLGTPEYNETLSQKRARAVYEELQKRGVLASQLQWEGRGSVGSPDTSMATNGNPDDRRVEVDIE